MANFEFLKSIEAEYIKTDLPVFQAGDTVKVDYKIREGAKERVQPFQGVVIQRKSSGSNATFTVRKISEGIGVERIFPLNSPNIMAITVMKRGKVRRARIYYIRKLSGKKAAIKERIMPRTKAVK